MQDSRFKDYVLGFIVGAIIVIGYFSIDFTSSSENKKDVTYVTQINGCDLHTKPCEVKLDNMIFTMEVFPKEIPLMKPLMFRITTKNYNKDTIALEIYATNMQMGTQNILLAKVKDNVYEGTVILPTCIEGNMIWNADITLKKIGAKFQFKTGK